MKDYGKPQNCVDMVDDAEPCQCPWCGETMEEYDVTKRFDKIRVEWYNQLICTECFFSTPQIKDALVLDLNDWIQDNMKGND